MTEQRERLDDLMLLLDPSLRERAAALAQRLAVLDAQLSALLGGPTADSASAIAHEAMLASGDGWAVGRRIDRAAAAATGTGAATAPARRRVDATASVGAGRRRSRAAVSDGPATGGGGTGSAGGSGTGGGLDRRPARPPSRLPSMRRRPRCRPSRCSRCRPRRPA